jgi:type II secretory pathway pseudopilin PulG
MSRRNPLAMPRDARRGRCRRGGFTLLEATIATMLVGVLLAVAMQTVAVSVAQQQRTATQVLGGNLADGLLAEILSKAYRDPDGGATFGTEAGESRSSKTAFDDVDDFHLWTEAPPQYPSGDVTPNLAGWRRSVTIAWGDQAQPTVEQTYDTGVKQIRVVVQFNGQVVATRYALRTEAP